MADISLVLFVTPSIEQGARRLSGGSQQKALVAKWLAIKAKILIVDELPCGIDYSGATDSRVVNLTNHVYWNLKDEGTGSIDDHTMWINADRYTPTDDHLIPTGELAPVEGTPFDFRTHRAMGAATRSIYAQLIRGVEIAPLPAFGGD